MKFFLFNKTLKNGFYIDYFIKNIFFKIYKLIISNNFIYCIDKYLTELFFFSLKKSTMLFFFISDISNKLTFIQLIKIILLITIQIIIIIIL